jgi:hypothetical protein
MVVGAEVSLLYRRAKKDKGWNSCVFELRKVLAFFRVSLSAGCKGWPKRKVHSGLQSIGRLGPLVGARFS